MSPILKRTLLLMLLLAVAVLIGYGLYYLLLKPPTPEQVTTPGGGTPAGQLPGAGERQPTTTAGGEITPGTTGLPQAQVTPIQPSPSYYQPTPVNQITSEFATYPSLSNSGALRYYNASDGKFYRVGADGTIKTLSDQVFYNASKVTWANGQDKAVIEYPDSSKIVYNFDTKKQVSLPKHWEDFSFSADGSQIAAKSVGLSPENRWLITTNDDGTGTKTIEPIGENADKVTVDWSPSGQAIAFSNTGEPLGADRQQILLIGKNNENFPGLVVEGLGFQPNWSPTGQKLLYSVYSARSDYKPELWIVNSYGDQIGANRQMVNLNTWADKCTFVNENTVFCAVPRDLPTGAGMSPAVANDTFDDLYKVDLKTGLKTTIATGGDYQIQNLNYNTDKNKLFFTAGNQSGIFQVQL